MHEGLRRSATEPSKPSDGIPTRWGATVHGLKALLLQARRAWQDRRSGPPRHGCEDAASLPCLLAENRTPLWADLALEEHRLELNKVENLRQAARALDGIVIPAEQVFSFWRQVGRTTRGRGYIEGRQLLEGCLIPAVGGGICQLTNALYDIALQAGFEIVERHPHSRIVPGSAAERDHDATVAWNYIDLRFRVDRSVRLQVHLNAEELVVGFWSQAPVARLQDLLPILPAAPRRVLEPNAHSCETCGVERCFRHPAPTSLAREGAVGYLLDECWPELSDYVGKAARPEDVVGMPLDGTRWGKPQYAWPTQSFGRAHTATLPTLTRAGRSRRLGRYGAARLEAQLEGARELAAALARGLTPEITHLCVSQTLLPFLWQRGDLGGRRFEVLLTQTPLAALHQTLDRLRAEHPERSTLNEYRAPDAIVRAEAEALAAAERVVTPHTALAAGFPGRAHLVPWQTPIAGAFARGTAVGFPGPTAARKGAYELRSVARQLDLEIVLYGSELEGAGFWDGVRTRRVERGDLTGVGVVVQPSYLEDRPRALLAALAAGLPVIATPACGLPTQQGLRLIDCGNEEALAEALRHRF